MKNLLTRRRVLAISGASQLSCGVYCLSSSQTALSPDVRYRASVTRSNCQGALGAFVTDVAIEITSGVAAYLPGRRKSVFTILGDPAMVLVWRSPTSLLVRYSPVGAGKVKHKATAFRDVIVDYQMRLL